MVEGNGQLIVSTASDAIVRSWLMCDCRNQKEQISLPSCLPVTNTYQTDNKHVLEHARVVLPTLCMLAMCWNMLRLSCLPCVCWQCAATC